MLLHGVCSEKEPVQGAKSTIRVSVPSRIHCGLINENGIYGRVDGGIGFAVDHPRWIVDVGIDESSRPFPFTDEELSEARNVAVAGFGDVLVGRDITVKSAMCVPAHIGLGSKTALQMGVARAVCALTGLEIDDYEIALRMRRGGTSGVGIQTALRGGFVWDAGHSLADKRAFGPSSAQLAPPARTLARYDCTWLQVVHFRFCAEGIHGQQERDLFSKACPVDAGESLRILQAVAWGVAPAVLEQDESRLQSALSEIQSLGFKRHEWDIQDEITKAFRHYWNTLRQPEALGISSVGPTLYILTSRPDTILEFVRAFGQEPVHCEIATIDNSGMRTTLV
ncbi:MAG TPA: beta-ribofuranosylaminobenzene 5'-phosphate synthase family protein [Bryobacteraceae bacterium]|nr:beta-ribofuranosylaminobenzene 5'-phosphate synthase family protein [Bryobacteraceae bacterium]